jgi:predicted enzyme related to lactoylglutathione lyase
MAQKPNSVVHVEIHSNAPEKTKEFLKDVFDWKFEDMPEMNYSTFQAPSAPGGGLQKAENLPAGVLDYILSKDIDGTLKKIQSSGGAIVMPKAEIPGMGWFAVFQDPTGITLALYEVGPRPRAARAQSRRRATKSAKKSAAKGRKRGRRSR